MNLEHVSAVKNSYNSEKFHPKPTKLSIFSKISVRSSYDVSNKKLGHIMHRMFESKLCGRQEVFDYLSRQLRHNYRPNTIRTNGTTILLFLEFFKLSGGRHLAELGPEHISAFVEHEQDRGMSPVSIEGRLNGLYAFLSILVDRGVISADVIKRKLRIKVPDILPRAIDPEDIRQLLTVTKRSRDRALILTLLRTGMRIGELLNTRMEDLNLREKSIQIIEAEKNRVGRMVYLSVDAVGALRKWIKARDCQSEFIFYGLHAGPLCYGAAYEAFKRCIHKAGQGVHVSLPAAYIRQ